VFSIKVEEFQRTRRVCARHGVFHLGLRFHRTPTGIDKADGMAGFNNYPSPSDCPIQLLQHAPLLRQAICRVVQRAGARLGIRSRAVPYPALPQDRLNVDLDGRLGDVARARNHLVGMPLHETIENLGLALRKCRHTECCQYSCLRPMYWRHASQTECVRLRVTGTSPPRSLTDVIRLAAVIGSPRVSHRPRP
jgi:hypothetical protein